MADPVRCWLVERDYTDKGLVTLVYATPDGERKVVEQRASNRLRDVTAAREVDPGKLVPAEDDERDRFASEVSRMMERHDPDETV